MWHISAFLSFIALVTAGCSGPEMPLPGSSPPLSDTGGGAAHGPFEPATGPDIPVYFAARTSEAGVAIAALSTGEVLTSAGGQADLAPVDLVCDPWLSRLIVLGAVPGEEGGEISSYSVDGAVFSGEPLAGGIGPREHEVWVDGVARLAASPEGAIVFEDGPSGSRWRLVSTEGISPSVSAPRPAAIELRADGEYQISALTYGPLGDSLDIRAASVGSDGLHLDGPTPLALPPPGDSPRARWARTAFGITLLAAANGDVLLSRLGAGTQTPWAALGVGVWVDHMESAIALEGGHTLVALTSGDVDVVVAHLDDSGAPACSATLDLPGDAEPALHFFSRSLAPAGPGRALIATTEGVTRISVAPGCPASVSVDPAFNGDALRGPIEACRVTP